MLRNNTKHCFQRPLVSFKPRAPRPHRDNLPLAVTRGGVVVVVAANVQPQSRFCSHLPLRIFRPQQSSYSTVKHTYSSIMLSAAKLVPDDPSKVMVIRDVTPNIVTLSLPFARLGRFRIGGRATILKLSTGALVVFSPVALTDEVRAKVASMGNEVSYLVAPDMEHHIFLSQWAAEFPSAKIIGPAGLAAKRASQRRKNTNIDPAGNEKFFLEIDAATKLDRVVSPEFDADIAIEFMSAHPSKEIVLFFKPDQVVVEADVFFNLPAREQYSRSSESERGPNWWGDRLFHKLQSTEEANMAYARRFMWYFISAKDRAGFSASLKRIDGWDFTTVVPCHGEVMEGDGKERFRRLFKWHLEKAGKLE